jgi:hypothetical protein
MGGGKKVEGAGVSVGPHGAKAAGMCGPPGKSGTGIAVGQ